MGKNDIEGQMSLSDLLNEPKLSLLCKPCICNSCLYWWSNRCPHGEYYDDLRARKNPYDKVHPDKTPRTGWSEWNKPGEQAHWCRGGIFYPVSYCEYFAKYKGCTIKECLKCNVAVYQDGYIACSLLDSCGCERCYEEFERRMERC